MVLSKRLRILFLLLAVILIIFGFTAMYFALQPMLVTGIQETIPATLLSPP